ncbi:MULTISPECIES: F0F1 ATP synthase subunit epsilon [Aliiruegeria]|uniref:ATP synthase epsilon chain n=1 Tax=Aliiruegeria lutimaris TaxID=571298 RepID=A0A1G8PL67_9RHOB|nr:MULTISPECIES: F0F1 ATP synthase subunit epsilon [Aliiruegeria]NDR57214.1 F0F1 ATP synthase subunit epsilon [Pseudoruegeria sp. M32A2M]SDI93233.1 ATP synthase F1 subcomplex epsilon subunit [Aliiruegeria lutimaris]
MANTMQFDLVSPEKRLASLEATQVQIPAAEGDMTAMPDHAPVIVTLRPGLLKATGVDGTVTQYAVTGGFAEINADSASVLAEFATVGDGQGTARAALEGFLEEARKRAGEAQGESKDVAEKFVADLVHLLEAME